MYYACFTNPLRHRLDTWYTFCSREYAQQSFSFFSLCHSLPPFLFSLPFDELFSCYRLLPYYHLQLLAHRPEWRFFTQKIWITAICHRIFHVTGSKFQLHWLLSHGSSLLFHPLSCFGCWAPYEQQFHQNNLQFYFIFFFKLPM